MSEKTPVLPQNAIRVLERRYLMKDADGRVAETPAELFRRVAYAIAAADANYGASPNEVEQTAVEFYHAMVDREFMPNSPTLMNAGRPLGQLSACFVLPVGDSMEEIFESIKNAALIHKSGGGTGFAFSRLRPSNSQVRSTSGVASGPVSFMKVFNAATEAVKQGGTRRGANMGILRVDHPDIEEFITCKSDLTQVTNFNISVAVTDDFMNAVEAGTDYDLINPRTRKPYEANGQTQRLNARQVFSSIVEHAWSTGEPGVIYIDRINRENPTNRAEEIEATNPCGEQPLPPYDSCNLASINLGTVVKRELPNTYDRRNPSNGVDWEKLTQLVKLGVHFLDNVIDINKYPIPEIAEQTHKNRRIGLGVMGWADMLATLGVRYDSEEAFELGKQVMEHINDQARMYSSELGAKRGKFPNWDKSIFEEQGEVMRNSTVTTVAPTGTISIIAGCSSGIEPYFSISFVRNVMEGTRLVDVNPIFETIAKERGFYSPELMERIANSNSIQDFDEVPQDVRDVFVTTADITAESHIRMQSVFQKHCDSAVSKTINLPHGATQDDVQTAYWLAYRQGCKGVTIYRDGSRPGQVLSTGATPESSRTSDASGAFDVKPAAPPKLESTPVVAKSEPAPAPKPVQAQPAQPAKPKQPAKADADNVEPLDRPEILEGFTEKVKTGYGNLYVTVNTQNGRPFEVFASIGKSGYSTMADTEAICRLISLALRSHIPVRQVVKQLQGIGGSQPVFEKGGVISSIPDAIAKVLNDHFGNGHKLTKAPDISKEHCPDCGGLLEHEEGCVLCRGCGYSQC
ncbi:MAG: vitamin B12-dependent ribonucleotide reductase [candidate division Zixibacteria bacterium]|nr:vitamin B12-dependent ribonucleotide reductase [candidate division Zixibacteria bacterium]